jgi:hypothetical protein
MVKITCTNVMQLWANQYPEVMRWLTHLQKKESSALFFYHFCEWAHKTPPELLALKEKDATITPPPNTVEKLLDEFCGADLEDFTSTEKYNTAIQVKSFFKWSYRSLEKACGVVNYEKVKPYNALNKEGLRKLYNRALNPRDRALIPFVTCTGIAKETLANLLWGHLEENWESKDLPTIDIGPELLKGHGKGKYKGVRQITFLTPEAKRELVNYKDWIEGKLGRKLTAQDHVWLTTCNPYEPLSYDVLAQVTIALSKRAKVPFSLHDGRRWINTALEQIGISSNWARKIRGRKVKGEEAPYSQPAINQLKEKFREAVPLLEFTSEASSTVDERLKAVEKIMQDMTPEQRETMQRHGIKMFAKTEAAKRKDRKEKECTDGEHCQRVVSEEALPELLAQGWHASIVLPSGKIVLER